MAEGTRDASKGKVNVKLLAIGAPVVALIFGASMWLTHAASPEPTHSVLRAWYVPSADGPLAVVWHAEHTDASRGTEPRYDTAERLDIRVETHRLSDAPCSLPSLPARSG